MKLQSKQNNCSRESSTSVTFLNPYAPIQQHKHRVPHWQQGPVSYFVTWQLADSLPANKLARWTEEKHLWLQKNPPPWSAQAEQEYYERFSRAVDDWLDAGEGACLLAVPALARCVADALMHFDNERYVMESSVIMPNHIHVLFRLIEPYQLEKVIKSWKGFTAREINQLLQRHGTLWQEDYWDRTIRDDTHLLRCRDYIRENPQKAHLTADQFVLLVRETKAEFSNRAIDGGQECPPSNVRPPR